MLNHLTFNLNVQAPHFCINDEKYSIFAIYQYFKKFSSYSVLWVKIYFSFLSEYFFSANDETDNGRAYIA